MTSYKRFTLAAVLVGTAAVATVFATFMTGRLRDTRKGAQKAALANWEDEGGSEAAPEAVTPAADVSTGDEEDRRRLRVDR